MAAPHLHDGDHHRLDALRQPFWAACGSLVVLSIFVGALGAVDPSDSVVVTGVVIVIAVAWLAHAWRRLWLDERPRG